MKIVNKSFISTISVLVLLLLFSCGHEHADGDGHDHSHGHNHGNETEQHSEDDGHGHGGHGHEDGEIHLSKEQIETMSIKFGDFSNVKINDFVKATGTLNLPPNAYSSVNAKANGFIKSTKKYVEGAYIKEGSIMGHLENPEFIEKQQEYLEIQAELNYLYQELERQKKLADANAGIAKNLQKVQSDINIKNVTLKGIGKQLAYLGINTYDLYANNITERIAIIAPTSGYITSVNMHNGMYATPQEELLEIVNDNYLHLELDIFEKDISSIKKGQRISYSVPAMGNQVYDGEIYIIGKEFNTENKTIRIYGRFEKDKPKFIKDLFVEAKIWLNDQTVQALPEKAIIKDGASSYIYVANNQTEEKELKFEAISVVQGTTDNGFTAVKLIDAIPDSMKIVTEGAYYVFAQSKAGELSHEH